MKNPIIELAQFIQKQYGENITTKVVDVAGELHCPDVTIIIACPDGGEYAATVKNKKIAKQKAAEEALKYYLKAGSND